MSDDDKKKAKKAAQAKKDAQFKRGNQFWKLRSTAGPKPTFATPEALQTACMEYFEAVTSTPMQAAELVKHAGKAKVRHVPKMRAMSVEGLCVFLDVSVTTWYRWKDKDSDLREVCLVMQQIMYAQKFEGAAAGMLNAAIVARKLGLADRKEVTGPEGGPVELAASVRLNELVDKLAPQEEDDEA